MALKLHVLNSTGILDGFIGDIEAAYKRAITVSKPLLKLDQVDVVVRHLPYFTIPELRVGGFTNDDGHSIYLSVDAKKGFLSDDLYKSLLHELHHAKRFQMMGWPENLAGHLVAEGLACLFEAEQSGQVPIYATVDISKADITKAQKHLFSKDYNHADWFFGSDKLKLPRWFGYTHSYNLCKEYATKAGKKSHQLVSVKAEEILSKQ